MRSTLERPASRSQFWARVAPEYRGLRDAVLLVLPSVRGAPNLAGRGGFPSVAGTPAAIHSRVGEGVNYSAASSRHDYAADNHASQDLTLFMVGAGVTTGLQYFMETAAGTNGDGLTLAKDASNNLAVIKVGQGSYISSFPLTTGEPYAVVVQYRVADDSTRLSARNLFTGASLIVETGGMTGPSVAATVDGAVRLGGGSTTTGQDIAIYAAGIWYRNIGNGMADLLIRDPFGPFREYAPLNVVVAAATTPVDAPWESYDEHLGVVSASSLGLCEHLYDGPAPESSGVAGRTARLIAAGVI